MMADETIHWLQDTASANNTSTSSIDVAKVESERRRKYEEIVQANAMYKAARALGFPDKVSLDVKYQLPYYIIVSVHRCFDPKYYVSTEYDNGSLCFFYRLKLEPSDTESIYDQICIAPGGEEIPKFVVWLLICMKLFYSKDWDGRKWIDEKEGFKMGTYYLMEGKRIVYACDEVAIAFTKEQDGTYILMKHGDPVLVRDWIDKTRQLYKEKGFGDIFTDLNLYMISGKFPVEDLKRLIDTSGWVKYFLEKHNINLEDKRVTEK